MSKKFTFPFFVAEISANHNGSYTRAKKLIKLAKESEQTLLNYKPSNQKP